MRLLYLATAIPLTMISAPSDEPDRMALRSSPISTTRLDGPSLAPRLAPSAVAQALFRAVAPAGRDVPVMPIIPMPLAVVVPDEPPVFDTSASAHTALRADRASVTATALFIRSGPSSRHPVVASLARGDKPVLTGRRDSGWVQIRLQGTREQGWVHGAYLSF